MQRTMQAIRADGWAASSRGDSQAVGQGARASLLSSLSSWESAACPLGSLRVLLLFPHTHLVGFWSTPSLGHALQLCWIPARPLTLPRTRRLSFRMWAASQIRGIMDGVSLPIESLFTRMNYYGRSQAKGCGTHLPYQRRHNSDCDAQSCDFIILSRACQIPMMRVK